MDYKFIHVLRIRCLGFISFAFLWEISSVRAKWGWSFYRNELISPLISGSGHPIENPRHRSLALFVVMTTGEYVSLHVISMERGNFKQQPTFAINQFFRVAIFPLLHGNGPMKGKWEELSRFCHGC